MMSTEIEYPSEDAQYHPVNDTVMDPAEEAHDIYVNEGIEDVIPKAAQIMVVESWIDEHGDMYSDEVLEELRFLALY